MGGALLLDGLWEELVFCVNSALTVAFLVGIMFHFPTDAFTAGVR